VTHRQRGLLDQPDNLPSRQRGISCAVLPSPERAFFEQSVLEHELGDHLLQRAGLPAQILDLVRGRRPRGVPGQALLAGLQKFLRPAVIQVLDDPLAAAQLGDAVLAARPDSTMRIFSSAENWRRVARRISLTTCSAGSFTGPNFCPIFAPSMATMGQKSSPPQPALSVS
jgi:hypothetical protein